MRNRRPAALRFEWLESRLELSTLIAQIDTGLNNDATNQGYVDFADAFNAVDGSNNVSSSNSHGTLVAGYIAREIKSLAALTGRSLDVKILPIKVLEDRPGQAQGISTDALIDGIYYAISQHVSVINISLAGPGDYLSSSRASHPYVRLSTAIADAAANNILVVAAAGNNGDVIGGMQYGNRNIDIETPYPVHPAVDRVDHLIASMLVATSSDTSGHLFGDSNYGPVHVDLAAPCDNQTSYAAGYTSGVAGAVTALRPDWSAVQVADHLRQTVQTSVVVNGQTQHPLANLTATGGWINDANVVANLIGPPPSTAGPILAGTIIDPVAVTSTSTYSTFNNTITGNYLSSPLHTGDAVPSVYPSHSDAFWGNGITSPSPGNDGSNGTQAIVYQLSSDNTAYNLSGFHWWPYTSADHPERSIQSADVSTSTDNVHWSSPVPMTFGEGTGAAAGGEDHAITGAMAENVRYVKFDHLVNFGPDHDNPSASTDALAEIRFAGTVASADLAQGKAAFASSIESANLSANNAVDGSHATRWSSGQWMQGQPIGWIAVDLGNSYNINEVKLNWETAYAADYQIQTSNDATQWTTIKTVTGNTSVGVADHTGLSGSGRYVRIYCAATSAGSNNYSLFDLSVYGS